MDEADKSLAAYDTLYNSMPSIGFLSRKKRVIAFLKVTKKAQKMIDDEELSEDNALFLLSILAKKTSQFQKSAMMSALHLATIDRKIISTIGFKYANEMRANIQMLPIDDIGESS